MVATYLQAMKRALPKGGSLPAGDWNRRHKAICVLVWIHIAGIPLIGLISGHNTSHVTVVLAVAVAFGIVATWPNQAPVVSMCGSTFALLISASAFVHLSNGSIEAHFDFFVIIAVITLYQSWTPFLLAISFVVLHHGFLGAIDPSHVYNHFAAVKDPWKWAAIHGGAILAASTAGLVAWKLNETTLNKLRETYDAKLEQEHRHFQEMLEAQARVERSHERFEALVANSIDMVNILDQSGELVYSSPSSLRIMGHADGGFGKDGFEYIHPDDRQLGVEGFMTILGHPDATVTQEMRVRHGDGTYRWLEATTQNMLHHPAVEGVVIVSRDVTARKEAEQQKEGLQAQLLQAQKLEAVGQLAGGIAHDFNNLLSVILNNAELALLDVDPEGTVAADLREIVATSNRAAGVVRQLLSFSRREVLTSHSHDVREIVHGMHKMLRMAIPETVRLTQKDSGGSLWVNADRNRIEQIVLNLVVNARDALPEGGEIIITTGSRTIEEGGRIPAGEYALLSVEDTGTGIDEETLGRIFEPFFTTKDRKSGTGLGLSSVYGIVQEMGGHVDVRSEVGRGTTFEIVVPRIDPPALSTVEGEDSPETRTGSGTILVVEDERAVAAIIERILIKAGYEPLVAHSGKEALVVIGERPDIDLLITDAVMPGMSGQDLVQHIPNLPVLFISGYTEKMDALAQSGNFLPKPFTPEQLLDAVQRTLSTLVNATS